MDDNSKVEIRMHGTIVSIGSDIDFSTGQVNRLFIGVAIPKILDKLTAILGDDNVDDYLTGLDISIYELDDDECGSDYGILEFVTNISNVYNVMMKLNILLTDNLLLVLPTGCII